MDALREKAENRASIVRAYVRMARARYDATPNSDALQALRCALSQACGTFDTLDAIGLASDQERAESIQWSAEEQELFIKSRMR